MPTDKQRKLAKSISENIRKDGSKTLPTGTLMRKAGYSESTSLAPSRITQTKGFVELLKKAGVSDRKLAKRLNEGLDATKVVGYLNNKVDGTQKVSDEFVDVVDIHARHKYLLTALELKGHIKQNGNGKGAAVVIIQYGYRNDNSTGPLRGKVEDPSASA